MDIVAPDGELPVPGPGEAPVDAIVLRMLLGSQMTSDKAAVSGADAARKTGPLPFDTSTAHQARVYDYYLGGCFL